MKWLGSTKKNKYSITNNGLSFIKQWESFRSTIYLDSAGHQTIGWGHKLTKKEIKSNKYANGIGSEEANVLLKSDLQTAEDAVNRYVKIPIEQHQYDMLVSFVYNVGQGAFKKSTLLKIINLGPASDQFKRWIYAGGAPVQGLINRRDDESYIFENGYPW